MPTTRRVWWEKTVEYLFVSLFPALGEGFIAPLDGAHERAGDAIFANSDRWLLLEFKKDQSSVYREREKFDNYDEAAYALRALDRHHLLVYGFEESDGSLGLTAMTYFSHTERGNREEVLASGCRPGEFWTYLEKFSSFKKHTSSHGGSSSGGFEAGDYSMVMGVSNDGQATGCTTVAEFQKFYQKSIGRSLGQTHSRAIEIPTPTIPPPPIQKSTDRSGRGR